MTDSNFAFAFDITVVSHWIIPTEFHSVLFDIYKLTFSKVTILQHCCQVGWQLWGISSFLVSFFLHIFATPILYTKHCQRHNGPEGWVLLTKVTSSYTNLDQIPKFKISTKHQHFDQTLTSYSWPNNHFITSPSLSSKTLTKLQFQNFAWTSTSNSWPNQEPRPRS